MKNIALIGSLCLLFTVKSIAQGDIGNEEITITKEREIKLSKANRIVEKAQPIETERASKKITYTFFDRKPSGVQESNFQPNIIDPTVEVNKNAQTDGFYNFLKLGGGNYGRFLGEGHFNSYQNDKFVFGVYGLQNSSRRGPVDDENSSSSQTKIKVDGKYHSANFELKAFAGYERKNYHFFGYDTTRYTFTKDQIRQRLNLFNYGLSFENTKLNSVLDYQVSTELKTLKDYISAEEIDWGSHLNLYFPILKDRIIAVVKSDAFLNQRTDNLMETNGINKRNLFRVEPSFNFMYNQFGLKVAYKAVNQFDEINQINVTKGFPSVEFTYKTPSLLYFSAGIDGDIIRNTLNGMLAENPFLRNQVTLKNTEKSMEYYIASKGELLNGLSYHTRFAFGQYKDLYYFNIYDMYYQPAVSTRQFEAYYEPEKSNVFHVNTQLNYQPTDAIRSNLDFNYYFYETHTLARPYHRPSLNVKLNNSFVVSEKFVASLDVFLLSKMYATNPFNFNEEITLPTIVDLNTQFDYLIGKQFTAFVKLNNILGKNYQRYAYYPQQGLNFLVGVNVSL